MYQLFNFILITWRDLFSGKAKEENKEVNWSTLSSSHTVTFQEPITLAAEVIERARILIRNYTLVVKAQFNSQKDCAELVEINDNVSSEILLARIIVSGSDCTPVEIQIINYNLTEDELKFFSGMGSNVRPDQKLPLKIVTAEDLLY